MGSTEEFRSLMEMAIREERKAQRLYRDLAAKAKDGYTRAILEGLLEQEVLHEKKLKALLASVHPGAR